MIFPNKKEVSAIVKLYQTFLKFGDSYQHVAKTILKQSEYIYQHLVKTFYLKTFWSLFTDRLQALQGLQSHLGYAGYFKLPRLQDFQLLSTKTYTDLKEGSFLGHGW